MIQGNIIPIEAMGTQPI